MNNSDVYIDIEKVFRQKNPRLFTMIPRFIFSYIKKIIHQNDLNRDLRIIAPYKGAEKMRKFLEIHSIKTHINGREHIPADG
nr:hypothetical protein [Bacteroidales bacterium]